ncbi:MAG: hypothetical protein H6748_18160 [Spirochaetaceae bacterium]|nr:hypothetical protein [Myxococcales bacterium]MCB9725979.1 hypothetical protein [Spirochaetaceae bacterium]
MSDSHLPSPSDPQDDERRPEVRLELTRAGVQEVLSLYSQEQRASQGETGFALRLEDIERAIRERRRMLLLGLLGGVALAVLIWLASTPLYPVSAQVVLDRYDVATRGVTAAGASAGSSSFVATQAEIMQSASVVSRAVAAIPRAEHLDPDDDGLHDALESIRATPVSGTQVVALGYLGPDPGHGARLIEAIVDAYRAVLAESEEAAQRQQLEAKEAEIAVLDAEAADLEAKLEALRKENEILGTAQNTLEAQNDLVRDLSRQLTEARNERIALENRLATGGEQLAILDPAVRSLQEQLWAAEAELARVRLTLKPKHPAVEAAQREVSVLRSQLAASSRATPNALKRDVAAAKGLEEQLTELYERERGRLATIERDRREEALLLGEVERVSQMADARRSELLDQRLLTRLARSGEVGVSARLIAEPVLPESPVWPRPMLLLAAGAGLGLLVGFVAALVSLRREREAVWETPAGSAPPGRAAGVARR